jgi:hypothetical protein
MVVGAWQDMFKLIHLEERPVNSDKNAHVLHSDSVNKIVMKEVSFFLGPC